MRPASFILVLALALAGIVGWFLFSTDEFVEPEEIAVALAPEDPEPEPEPEGVTPRKPIESTRRNVEVAPKPEQLGDVRGEPSVQGSLRVRGRVVDSSRTPLEGIRISLGPREGDAGLALDVESYPRDKFFQILRATSDREGQFEFVVEQTAPGWSLMARAPGYANLDLHELQLPDSGFFEMEDLIFEQAVEISGRVFNEQSQSVQGARIHLARDRGPDAVGERYIRSSLLAVSEAGGSFHVVNAKPGLVTLLVTSDEYPSKLYTGPSAQPGEHLNGVVIRMVSDPELVILTGLITEASRPVEGALVRLYLDMEQALDAELLLDAPTEASASTDRTGQYRFENLTRGDYAITVERPHFGMRQLWTIELEEKGTRCDLNLDTLAIRGTVKSREGDPLGGVKLHVERVRQSSINRAESLESEPQSDPAAISRTILSGPDGSFTIDSVDSSTALVVIAEDRWRVRGQSEIFSYPAGSAVHEVELVLDAAGALVVQLNAISSSYIGLRLAATPLDREAEQVVGAPADPSGLLEITGLRPGPYQIELVSPSPAEELPPPIEGTILANQDLELIINLP